jgi:ubiquinone biosynthesis protein
MLFHRLENIGRTFKHLQRTRDVVRVFLKYGYEDIAHKLHLPSALKLPLGHIRAEQQAIAGMPAPERLRRACEELGPTFVKAGQILSTRRNLLPEAFTRELAKLQDAAAPVPFAEVKTVIEGELKRPLNEVFASVDETPLGAASIAQVHRARLLDGCDVVVKVQRPGIERVVETDLEIMRQLAGLIERHIEAWRAHHPVAVVDQMARMLGKEMDFTIEAGHMERFAWQFLGEPGVHVPRAHHHAVTRRVLTMEYVGGVKLSQLDTAALGEGERVEIATRVADLVMRQILVHGFFHADPHPGNLHILPGHVVCFLDFGMMGCLDQRGREGFVDLVGGIARRNETIVANALLRLSSADNEPPREGLEADVAEFIHQHFYRPVEEMNFGQFTAQLLQLTGRHGLQIPPDFFVMLKAMGLMESVVRELNPRHNVIEQVRPFLRQVRLERMRPRRVLEALFEFGRDFTDMARELPGEIRRIMSQLKVGEARLVFHHEGLEPAIHSAERISNRIAFSVVLAAMIIGSSVVIHSGIPPRWHDIPVIGLAGYLVSALMAVWLLWSILRHGRM